MILIINRRSQRSCIWHKACHTYHTCHIEMMNMIDMTDMTTIEPKAGVPVGCFITSIVSAVPVIPIEPITFSNGAEDLSVVFLQ